MKRSLNSLQDEVNLMKREKGVKKNPDSRGSGNRGFSLLPGPGARLLPVEIIRRS
jgi:hypothetical protein